MPVSHIGLTVSHLPTSCSFFLSALQPLGYRYIGQQGQQIGLGTHDADFYLCQESPGLKAGAAHIAFTARSRSAVREFYAAALTAGGRPNGAPGARSDDDGNFNAAVLDMDGNSIEVVFKNGPDFREDGTIYEHSRIITWRRTTTETLYDARTVVSSRMTRTISNSGAPAGPPTVVSAAPSDAPKPPSIARSASEPTIPQAANPPPQNSGDSAAKTIIGTLLGAAAGAAVAYAMVSSERDSARKEAEFNAFKTAKAAFGAVSQFAQDTKAPMQPADPQPMMLPAHRNISDTASQYSPPPGQEAYVQRAIEPAPSTYSASPPVDAAPKAPSVISVSRQLEYAPARSVASTSRPTSKAVEQVEYYAASVAPSVRPASKAVDQVEYYAASTAPSRAAELRAIEYAPAASMAPPRSHASVQRSMTMPELGAPEKARSTVSKAHSTASKTHTSASKPQTSGSKSKEPSPSSSSSFISTFVPDEIRRTKTEGSIAPSHASHKSSRSRSKHSHHSKHHRDRSSSRDRSSRSQAPSEAPSAKAPSKVGSVLDSILGRDRNADAKSTVSYARSTISNPFGDKYEIESDSSGAGTDDDNYTIAPSDSISNAGSSHRRRRHHRSKHSSSGSAASSSGHSKHSRVSRHSGRSHRSSARSSEYYTAEERLSTIHSEPSEASTIKPKHRGKGERKDSVTQYDAMFNNGGADTVQYGTGSVAVRGITPSMIAEEKEEKEEKPEKMSMGAKLMNWRMAQRLKAFEN